MAKHIIVSTEKVETTEGLLRGKRTFPLKGDRSSDGVRTTPEGRSPYGISSHWGFSVRTNLNQLHNLLIKNKKTLSVAESCTGGLISNLFTQLPDSSKYFILGIVAYSNKIKTDILKIPSALILRKGAVSQEVAEKMAQSVRKLAKTYFGIGITGIAGPSGGSSEKPVGTVFIAIDSQYKKVCKKFDFKGKRNIIRQNSALKAFDMLKTMLSS